MYAKYEPSVLALFVRNLELKCDVINVLFISSYNTFVRNVSYHRLVYVVYLIFEKCGIIRRYDIHIIISCFCASACVPSKVPSVNDTIRDSRHTDSRHTSLSASSGDHTRINESSMNLRSN